MLWSHEYYKSISQETREIWKSCKLDIHHYFKCSFKEDKINFRYSVSKPTNSSNSFLKSFSQIPQSSLTFTEIAIDVTHLKNIALYEIVNT